MPDLVLILVAGGTHLALTAIGLAILDRWGA